VKTIAEIVESPEFQMGLMAAMMTANTLAPAVKPYEAGQVDDLLKRSVPGDELQIHHVPQSHPAEQVIPGYSPSKGPGIALPRREHQLIPTERGPYTGTPRDLVANDLWKLRKYTGAPNSALQDLLDLIRQIYPGALNK